jgi:hypothetical protein
MLVWSEEHCCREVLWSPVRELDEHLQRASDSPVPDCSEKDRESQPATKRANCRTICEYSKKVESYDARQILRNSRL